MRVIRLCVICGKEKTGGVGKFTKARNLQKRLSLKQPATIYRHGTMARKMAAAGKTDYVCSICQTELLRRYPRPKEELDDN